MLVKLHLVPATASPFLSVICYVIYYYSDCSEFLKEVLNEFENIYFNVTHKTLMKRMFTFLDASKDLLIPQSTGNYKHILKICHEHNTNIYTEYIY